MNEEKSLVIIQKEGIVKRTVLPVLTGLVGLGIGIAAGQIYSPAKEAPEPEPLQQPAAKPAAQQLLTGTDLLMEIRNQDSNCSLADAIAEGNLRALIKLCRDESLLDQVNNQGNTALHLAAANNREDMVYELLRAGANPLIKNNEDQLPSDLAKEVATRRACLFGEELRKLELALFDDLNRGRNKSKTIEDDIRKAIELGINPNAYTGDNKLPLLSKILYSGCSASLVKTLLDAGANPSQRHRHDGGNPLFAAVSVDNMEALKMLLRAGVDPLIKKNNGASVLHDAIWLNRIEIAKELAPYYKICNFSPQGYTVGYAPDMAIHEKRNEILQILIDAGMDVNHPMFNKPLLISAVQRNRPEMVDILLKAGANKNARDKDGKRAIDYATDEAMAQKLR